MISCEESKTINEAEDPYLWLEEVEGDKALSWVQEQNKQSGAVITADSLFEPLKSKYLEVFNDTDKTPLPQIVGDYVYNFWQDETHVRGIWRRMPLTAYLAKQDTWEVVLDVDKLSETENKQWVFHEAVWLAPDNTKCMISLSNGGTDKDEKREFDVTTKSFVQDGFNVPESKGNVVWKDENTLLVATNFGKETMSDSGYPLVIKEWRRGTQLADAEVVCKSNSKYVLSVPQMEYYNSEIHNFILNYKTFFTFEFIYLAPDGLKVIDFPEDAKYKGFFDGQILLHIQSDWKVEDEVFESGSLVSLDLATYLKGKTMVTTIYNPDEHSSFESLVRMKNGLVLNTTQDVQNKLYTATYADGKWSLNLVPTPDYMSVVMVTGSGATDDYFFNYSNFITPITLVHGNTTTTEVFKTSKDYFNTANLTIDQYFVNSKDGTRIPYFMVHAKDIELDGTNPTLVYAYGGFNITSQPNYNSIMGNGWLAQGGVYVLANIRGGGEYGPEWHKAAMREKRQNAYDDLFAVSEDVIAKNITAPEHMGFFGWSNGGLLAGVALTQRPDLYKTVVVGAPLLDMKRFHKLLAGASWIAEYGDPDNPDDWEYLQKFSPYQNMFTDKEYPDTFIITSTKDDRVHPGHARKMAAKMLAMNHKILYHETEEGGHRAASTNAQGAEMWAYIFTYLNMKLNR